MKTRLICVVTAALMLAMGTGAAWSQATMAKVKGTITDGGKPVANADVVLTSLGNGKTFKFKTDKGGQLSGIGVPFGDYEEEIISSTGDKLYKKQVRLTGEGGAPDDISVEISSGGTAGQPKYTKEQIEKMKAENAKATNMNAMISQYNAAKGVKADLDKAYASAAAGLRAKHDPAADEELKTVTEKYHQDANKASDDAAAALTLMIGVEPDRWEFYQALGGVQSNYLGLTGDDMKAKYQGAIDTYEKGIKAAQDVIAGNGPKASGGSGAPDPAKAKAGIGQMLGAEGNAYLRLNKQPEAIAALTKSAEMDPNPGIAFFNLCAIQYNAGNVQAASSACDKAIAADPNKADAYFIKGSVLIGMSDGKLDPNGHLIVPPGTKEALNKYLELAPEGGHANDVKAMLDGIGAKIDTSYKENKGGNKKK